MASITDCVADGLKYPFSNIKNLLCFGVLFAFVNALSTYIGIKSFDIFRVVVHITEKTNTTLTHVKFSQLPVGDIYLVAGLTVVIFIVALLIMGYQYNTVKFSIDKKEDLPGFDDAGILLKGIKFLAVGIAYNIIPILVLAGGLVLSGDSSALTVIGLISVVLFIIAFFIMIMALSNMIAHDDFKKAFDFNEILGNISNLGWSKYIGIIIFTVIVMMIINVAVNFVLSFVTVLFAATVNNQAIVITFVIAIIEGLLVNSYINIFFLRVIGSVYRESIK